MHWNPFYWYYDSTCFGQPFYPSSGVLSLHRLWYILCSLNDRMLPGVGWQFHPTPGSIQSSKQHKMYQSRCTAKNSWWWAERLLETCRVVIPIKLDFSASVGFIHKESVTMHGHTIVKWSIQFLILEPEVRCSAIYTWMAGLAEG